MHGYLQTAYTVSKKMPGVAFLGASYYGLCMLRYKIISAIGSKSINFVCAQHINRVGGEYCDFTNVFPNICP